MKLAGTLMFSLLLSTIVSANDQANKDRWHGKISQEAIDACKGKANGTTCNFTNKNSDVIDGTCFRKDETVNLACRAADERAKDESNRM